MNCFFRAGSLLALSASLGIGSLHAQNTAAKSPTETAPTSAAPVTAAPVTAAPTIAPTDKTSAPKTVTSSSSNLAIPAAKADVPATAASAARVMEVPPMQKPMATRGAQNPVPVRSALELARMRRDLDVMNAAFAGDTLRLRELVRKGGDVNAADWRYGFTPLMWAARNGHVAAVRYLATHGAKINARSKVGVQLVFDARTPAVSTASGAMKMMLIAERGGVSALAVAAANGWGMAARELIKHGADVNLASPDGDTALMAAAFNGDLLTAKTLLDKGAKPNATDRYGRSALWLAALRGQESVVRELLARGAKPAADQSGTWPSDAAKAMQMTGAAALLARAERAPRAALDKQLAAGKRARGEDKTSATKAPIADRAMTGAGGIIILN